MRLSTTGLFIVETKKKEKRPIECLRWANVDCFLGLQSTPKPGERYGPKVRIPKAEERG